MRLVSMRIVSRWLIVLAVFGCDRAVQRYASVAVLPAAVTPTVTFPAIVVANSTGLIATIDAPIDGLYYDWTLLGATIRSASRTTHLVFDAGGVGNIFYTVTVSNADGATATPVSGSAQVVAALPSNSPPTIVAPARVLVGATGISATVASPLADTQYTWQASGAGVIDAATSTGTQTTFAATSAGTITLSVTETLAGVTGGGISNQVTITAAPSRHAIDLIAGAPGGPGYYDGPALQAQLGSLATGDDGVFTAADTGGTFYWSDSAAQVVRRLSGGVISTVAGAPFVSGDTDDTGGLARFNRPQGIAVATAAVGSLLAAGDVLVADHDNCALRRVTPAGVVTTLNMPQRSSTDPASSCADDANATDPISCTLATASFADATYVAIDSSQNIYVTSSNTIRVFTSTGQELDNLDLESKTGCNGIERMLGLAVDSTDASSVYLLGFSYNTGDILLTPLAVSGGTFDFFFTSATSCASPVPTLTSGIAVLGGALLGIERNAAGIGASLGRYAASSSTPTIVAGSATPGFANGAGASAAFYLNDIVGSPAVSDSVVAAQALSFIPGTSTLLVADWKNGAIRQVTGADGTGTVSTIGGAAPQAGDVAAVGTAARFTTPTALAIDGADNIVIADSGNGKLKQIAPDGTVTTLAGNGIVGVHDGPAPFGSIANVSAMALLAGGDVLFADASLFNASKSTTDGQTLASVIRRYDASTGALTTFAGGGASSADGVDGSLGVAYVFQPHAFVLNADGSAYFTDAGTLGFGGVRSLLPSGEVVTLLGGATLGHSNAGLDSTFTEPWGLVRDSAGTLYVSDASTAEIRHIVLGTSSVVVNTLACTGTPLIHPRDMVMEPDGNIVLIDDRQLLRITTPGAACAITPLAGTEDMASIGVRTGPLPGSLNLPRGLVRSLGGSFYLVDPRENVVLRIEE